MTASEQIGSRAGILAATAVAGFLAGVSACSPSPVTTEVVIGPMQGDKPPSAGTSTAVEETGTQAADPEPEPATVAATAEPEPSPGTATLTAESNGTNKQETVAKVAKPKGVNPKVKKPKAAAQPASPKACCAGKNDCKGLGGCKTNDNACMGKNMCKGKGGCSMGRCSNP